MEISGSELRLRLAKRLLANMPSTFIAMHFCILTDNPVLSLLLLLMFLAHASLLSITFLTVTMESSNLIWNSAISVSLNPVALANASAILLSNLTTWAVALLAVTVFLRNLLARSATLA